MRFFKIGLSAFAALAVLSACGGPEQGQTKTEKVAQNGAAFVVSDDGTTYKSALFDLSVQKPDGWVSASQSEADRLMNIGSEVVAGDDAAFKKEIEQGMKQSLTVFMLSRHPLSQPRPDNPNVSSVAENVLMAPQVKTGADYFNQMKLLTAGQNVPMTFADTYGSTQIDGQTFDTMEATFDIPGFDLTQTYYAARRGDHILAFIATATNDEDRAATQALLDSIKLDWD